MFEVRTWLNESIKKSSMLMFEIFILFASNSREHEFLLPAGLVLLFSSLTEKHADFGEFINGKLSLILWKEAFALEFKELQT